ncbi:MAG TPA: CPBP family intramembrane metalloprotease [Syntrophomonadaceae bacterium]|nr:CPBP family intramembrane metalloprotease [Syntrophomonadaceae bacterium]
MVNKPRWGWVEVILAYAATMLVVTIYGWYVAPYLTAYFQTGPVGNFFLAFLLQFLCLVGFTYLLAAGLSRGSWHDLGVKWVSASSFFRYGLAGGLGLTILILILSIPIQYFQPQLEPQYFETMLRSTQDLASIVLILIIGTVLGPFSEELFYRGMLYPVCRRYLGPVGGAILAGAIFGVAHWDLWRTIPLAIGGMTLCYFYEKTGSILVTTLAHGVWNGIMSLMLFSTLLATCL